MLPAEDYELSPGPVNHLAFTFCMIVSWLFVTFCPSLSDLRLQDEGGIGSQNCISTYCFAFGCWREDTHTVLENGLSSEQHAEVMLSTVKNAWAWISQVYRKEKVFHSSKATFLPPMPFPVVCFAAVIWEDIPPAGDGRAAPSPPWSPATELHIYGQTSYWDAWIPQELGLPIPVGCCHLISPFVQHSQPQRQTPTLFTSLSQDHSGFGAQWQYRTVIS